MYEHLVAIVWSLDKALLVCVGGLTLAVMIFAVVQAQLTAQRMFYLERMTDVMLVLSVMDKDSLARSCAALVEEASPQEFLEIAALKESIIPQALAGDFKTCLTASKKAALLEAQARSRRDKWLRIQALLAIGTLASENALTILRDASLDRDQDVAYYALRALAALKTAEACRVLIESIPRRRLSGQRIAALLEGFGPAAIETLLAATRHEHEEIRFWALKVLSTFKDDRVREEALRLSNDVLADVRAAACICLRPFKGSEVFEALIARLADEVWFVRLQAVRALREVAGADAIAHLAVLLSDKNWFVREEVKKAMTAFPEKSLPYINEAMEDKTARLEDCQEMLKNIRLDTKKEKSA